MNNLICLQAAKDGSRVFKRPLCILYNDACAFIVYVPQKSQRWNGCYFSSSAKRVCLPGSANRNTTESANVCRVTEVKRTVRRTRHLLFLRPNLN